MDVLTVPWGQGLLKTNIEKHLQHGVCVVQDPHAGLMSAQVRACYTCKQGWPHLPVSTEHTSYQREA